MAYPQSNGQVEAINKTLKESIMKRCEWFRTGWVDELPRILWVIELLNDLLLKSHRSDLLLE